MLSGEIMLSPASQHQAASTTNDQVEKKWQNMFDLTQQNTPTGVLIVRRKKKSRSIWYTITYMYAIYVNIKNNEWVEHLFPFKFGHHLRRHVVRCARSLCLRSHEDSSASVCLWFPCFHWDSLAAVVASKTMATPKSASLIWRFGKKSTNDCQMFFFVVGNGATRRGYAKKNTSLVYQGLVLVQYFVQYWNQ